MKTTIALAIILAAVPAFATELPIPPRSAGPRIDTKAACLARAAEECEAKNWTKLGKRACLFVKKRRCR